jgi:hypothetical protein
MAMLEPADYRRRAEECVEIAQTARTSAQRTMLLHIADTWLRLAKDAQENRPAPNFDAKSRRLTLM